MLQVENIWKSYEGQPLLRGVSFSVAAGETVCLLGRSGSGKSTLLRIITGLERPEQGRVLWEGQDLAGVPVHRRNFSLMFQDYALFPHRTVAENVAFGLRMQHVPPAQIKTRVEQALTSINMLPFANRRVTDLSGGEQQRVALARALAPSPRLLMLDEPLGALDRTLREQLMDELRRVLHQTGIPAIYVTHDQEEAFTFADRLVLLHDGQVEQSGTPAEIYNRPENAWVAQFFGQTNLLPGEVISTAPLRVRTSEGEFELAQPEGRPAPAPGIKGSILLRASGARPADGAPARNALTGTVEDVVFRGENFRIQLRTAHAELNFLLDQPLPTNQPVRLVIPPEEILWLPDGTSGESQIHTS